VYKDWIPNFHSGRTSYTQFSLSERFFVKYDKTHKLGLNYEFISYDLCEI